MLVKIDRDIGAYMEFTLAISAGKGEAEPCLTKVMCSGCDENAPDDCTAKEEEIASDFYNTLDVEHYNTTIEYFCTFGKQFRTKQGYAVTSYETRCKWDQEWEANFEVTECGCKLAKSFRIK